jgi:hypothetical protein
MAVPGRRALGNITNQQPRRMVTRQLKKAGIAGTEGKALPDVPLELELQRRRVLLFLFTF